MDAFICKCVFLITFTITLDQTFCAVDRHDRRLNENGVDELSMSSDEGTDEEEVEFHPTENVCVGCGRIEAKLTVTNGGPWGDWGPVQLCAAGSYAVGYDMKIERKKRLRDNTALNAIKLICQSRRGNVTGEVTSTVGHWGSWVGETKCQSRRLRKRLYLTSFDLQVQAPRKGALKDDTAANYVKFKCRDYAGTLEPTELVKPPGHGFWGTWGSWSAECPDYSAICGIQTRVEKRQGFFHDDTALNDVKFYCCL